MKIVIIGAGIGGLATAAALRRVGIETEIYEQAERFARIGAGIQQSPNAMKVNRGLGIEARLREVAFAPATSLNREAVSGAVINDHPLGRAVEARYDAHEASRKPRTSLVQAGSRANIWMRNATDPDWLYGYDAWAAPLAAAVAA